MNETSTTLQKMLDIEAPLLPADHTALFIAAGCGILLGLVLLVLWWRHYTGNRSRARRRLSRLQQATSHHTTDPQYRAYQLATILRIGLGLSRLTATTPLPARLHNRQAEWQSFIQQLDQFRYAKQAASAADLEPLFAQASFWLRRWSE